MRLMWLLAGLALAAPGFAIERVVTLSPHLAELVCAAGACNKLAGVVAYSDYPPEVQRLPQIGDAFNVNFERLLALKPDLVLAWEGGGTAQTIARLRQLHLRVEDLTLHRLDEIGAALRKIGNWLGTSATADVAAADFAENLQRLRERYRGASRLRVFYQIQTGPLFTISGGSPISEAIGLCGGDNVFADLIQLAASVNLEAVLAAKPDVVIYAQQDEPTGRLYWKDHLELPAAAAGRIYPIDANLLARATPRMLQGAAQLCEALDRARENKARTSLAPK